MRRLLVLLFLLPLEAFAQGAGTPAFRGQVLFPLTWPSDNTFDIGASGTSRPRTGYFGTSVVTPALTVSGATNTRVAFFGSGGVVSDDADLTFATDTLNATRVMTGAGTAALPAIGWQADNDSGGTGFYRNGANFMAMSLDGTPRSMWLVNGYQLRSDGTIEWCSTTSLGCSPDTTLRRVSAGVLKLSNAVSGNTFALLGGGANVASATALPVPVAGVYHVTGTTTITSITSTNIGTGTCIVLIFDGVLTLTDGSNLKLAGDFVTSADDTWTGCYDGTNWFETGRTVN